MSELIERSKNFFINALSAIDSKNFNEAESLLRKAFELTPDRMSILINLADVCRDLKKYEDCERYASRAISLDRNQFEAWKLLVELKYILNRIDEALSDCAILITLNSQSAEPFLIRSRILRKLNQFDKAVSDLDLAMIRDPNHPDIYSMKGRVHAEKHEWEQAKENYLKSLLLEKRNESAIAGLALLPDDYIPSSLAREIIAFADGGALFDDKSFWSFVLSELKKKSGHISEAFDALANANQMRFRELKNEKSEKGLKILQDHLKKIKEWSPTSQTVASKSQEILAILGPSRSGKTTIESLLSESGFIERAYESANASRMHAELNALHSQEVLDQKDIEKNVLKILLPFRDELFEAKKPISITNPFLLPSADVIYELYRNSRFIFLSRNEVDNACDIYKKDYQAKRDYFYEPDLIVEYIRLYNEIMEQLHLKFGKRSLMFRYEDIVADKNTVLNTVADWIGLEKNVLKLEPNEDAGDEYKAHPYRELFIKQYLHLFRSN